MARVLQVKRGLKANMPTLAQAEFGFTTDANNEQLYIGNGAKNIQLARQDHKHTKSDITDFPTEMTPTAHNQAASTITAGTLAGQVQANATAAATLANAQVRDIQASTTNLTAGTSALATGTLYFVYE